MAKDSSGWIQLVKEILQTPIIPIKVEVKKGKIKSSK